MWNPNSLAANANCQDEDDSWEVKAFAEDTRNAMGTTWPPRCYTCTFCKREFRSAQALGGHMNVHRRDRARLHHAQSNGPNGLNLVNHPNAATSSSLLIPTQELVTTGGLCLLYSLPKPNAMFDPSSFNNVKSNPSTFLSVSPHPNVNPPEVTPQSFSSSMSHSSYTEASTSVQCKSNEMVCTQKKRRKSDSVIEGIDLELRLGCSSFGF